MHAAQTLAGQRVTVGEQHVGIRVVVAMAWLTLTAEHHGVAIVTGGTPESAATNSVNVVVTEEDGGHGKNVFLVLQHATARHVLTFTSHSLVRRNPGDTDTASCHSSAHNPLQNCTPTGYHNQVQQGKGGGGAKRH